MDNMKLQLTNIDSEWYVLVDDGENRYSRNLCYLSGPLKITDSITSLVQHIVKQNKSTGGIYKLLSLVIGS